MTAFRLSTLARSLRPSATLAVSARAKAMRAEGRTVYDLSAGEPDARPPEPVRRAVAQRVETEPMGYAPVPGLPELRAAAARDLAAFHRREIDPAEIVVTCGAKQALANLFRVALEPGDRVVLAAPYWVSYPAMVRLAGGEPVVVETRAADGFRLEPDALAEVLDGRVRLVVLNSPANPTGVGLDVETLRRIAEVVDRKAPEAWIVTDDIYRKITYDGFEATSAFVAAPGFERIVAVDGVSKSHAMTGYRVGFLYGPPEVVRAVSAVQGQTTSGAATPSQIGAVAALSDPACAEALSRMNATFARRRGLALERLGRLPGATLVPPDGAFYLFLDVSAHCGSNARFEDDVALATWLLEEYGVACVPGTPFGHPGGLRLSFAAADEVLDAAFDAMETAFARIVGAGA
ncbi:MAG: pyridoxal phosphate-dependent aminotransferase [Deltaproteobacteria bacterium]|nr:MAG: pyridoxal phosphate-dependent aminotransferase [Deltaproteobacteria bacterium]